MLVRKGPVAQCPCVYGNDVEQPVVFPGQLRQVQVRAVSVVSRMNVPHTKSKSDAIRTGERREAEGGRRKEEGGRREAGGGRRKAEGGRRKAEKMNVEHRTSNIE